MGSPQTYGTLAYNLELMLYSHGLRLFTRPMTYVQSNSIAYHFAVYRSSQMCGSILICDHANVDHQNQCLNTDIVKHRYQEYRPGLNGFGHGLFSQ